MATMSVSKTPPISSPPFGESVPPAAAASCCHEYKLNPELQKSHPELQKTIQTVICIVLAIFCACVSPLLFLPSAAVGIWWSMTEPKTEGPIGEARWCTQLYFENQCNYKFPETIAKIGGAAIAAHHIYTCSFIYVPMAGLALGHWFGEQASVREYFQGTFTRV